MQKLSKFLAWPNFSKNPQKILHVYCKKFKKNSFWVEGFFLFWLLFFILVWSKALFFDQEGNLIAGYVNVWGDWAAHFTMGTAMANRDLLLKTSPFLLGAKFSYPFGADLISAILLRATHNLIFSFIFPSFVFSIFLVWTLYYFFLQLWQNSKKAILSSLVFLFNGGVGFYFFAKEIISSKNPWQILFNPPHEFTRLDSENIKWINVIDSMIIPQRAFVLGFSLTLLALSLVYKNFYKEKKAKLWQIFIIGGILGIMPIIHTHSFLAAFIILVFWATGDITDKIIFKKNKTLQIPWTRIKEWAFIGVITSLLALPIISMFFWNQIETGFFKFYPGWLAKEFEINWLVFWFKNWFLIPPLAIGGFLIASFKNKQNFFIFGPFVFIFIIANLFLFQPFSWDNTKLIIWSAVGFSYLTIYSLGIILNKKSFFKHPFINFINLKKIILSVVFIFLISSGVIDTYRLSRHDLHSYTLYSHEELGLANWVEQQTTADSIWLTGDQHNHFLFNLTGRQSLLTYRGWLWTHGYKYHPLEKAVKQMFSKPLSSQDIFEKYAVNYIVIGPNEKKVWQANETQFQENFILLKETTNYKIFENKLIAK